MKSLTWTRESHGLFDYESKSIKKKDLKASEGGKLLRIGDSVEFVNSSGELRDDEETTTLFDLSQQAEAPDQFAVNRADGNHTNDWLWMVIRSMKERGYTI